MNNYWLTLAITINDVAYHDEIKVNANSLAGARHEADRFVEENYPQYNGFKITKIEQKD